MGQHRGVKSGRKTFYVISQDDAVPCPICSKKAVVPLTPKQLAEQPDDTTHVCHPGFGGCNHGFSVTP